MTIWSFTEMDCFFIRLIFIMADNKMNDEWLKILKCFFIKVSPRTNLYPWREAPLRVPCAYLRLLDRQSLKPRSFTGYWRWCSTKSGLHRENRKLCACCFAATIWWAGPQDTHCPVYPRKFHYLQAAPWISSCWLFYPLSLLRRCWLHSPPYDLDRL